MHTIFCSMVPTFLSLLNVLSSYVSTASSVSVLKFSPTLPLDQRILLIKIFSLSKLYDYIIKSKCIISLTKVLNKFDILLDIKNALWTETINEVNHRLRKRTLSLRKP